MVSSYTHRNINSSPRVHVPKTGQARLGVAACLRGTGGTEGSAPQGPWDQRMKGSVDQWASFW